MSNKEAKRHLTHQEQLNLLQARGLKIPDTETALSTIRATNYYRFSAYAKVFMSEDQHGREVFKAGVTFEELRALYQFDSDLRALLFSVVSEFEIRLRSSLAYHVGQVNPYLHMSGEGLVDRFFSHDDEGKSSFMKWLRDYEDRLASLSRSEAFVKWHIESYEGKLPIWVAVEILDFGSLSKFLRALGQGIAHQISEDFRLNPPALKSWVAAINELRNVVAHNGRTWNRSFVLSPVTRKNQLPADLAHLASLGNVDKFKLYPRIEFLRWFEKIDNTEPQFGNRLATLIGTFPQNEHVSLTQMGFPGR